MEAIFNQLNPPPALVLDTRRRKLQVWDPAHLLELVIKKCFKDQRFGTINEVRKYVHVVSVFFREPEVYEYLLPAARALCKRLYSPKSLKDLKFISHGAGLLDDFIKNFDIYEAALCEIAANHPNEETKGKAQGYISTMLRSDIVLSIHFLRGLMWILKRCSQTFQCDQGLINNFVNTQELLVHVIDDLNIIQGAGNTISPAVQYVFRDYLSALSSQVYVPPGRGTRNRPTGSFATQQQLQSEMLRLNHIHQQFIVEMRTVLRYYWYQNRKWWRESETRLPAAGHLLNKLEVELGIGYASPLKPDHKRCNMCNSLVVDNDKSLSRHKTANFIGNQYMNIPMLGSSFSITSQVELLPLKELSRDPSQVTDATFSTLLQQLKKAKDEVDRDPLLRGIKPTLQHYSKKLLITPQLRVVVNPGMLHLFTVLLSAAVSEALCETLGSEMEIYHKQRYTSTGVDNTDRRQQREMFVRRNAPPIGNNRQFVQKVADKMCQVGVPYIPEQRDAQNNIMLRRFRFATRAYYQAAANDPTSVARRTSVTVNNLINKITDKPRKGILETFF